MKKVTIMTLVLFMLFAQSGFTLLRKDIHIAKGPVVKIDQSKGEIVIRDVHSSREMLFTSLEPLNLDWQGKVVVISYKPGTSVANSVRLVQKGRKR